MMALGDCGPFQHLEGLDPTLWAMHSLEGQAVFTPVMGHLQVQSAHSL
jgi:hypothetical protein